MQTNPLALFGDHLACLRKARGWSQEKLALESGLARSYVSGIERGRRNVALVNICVLADTLGVPTSEMLRFAPAATGAQDGTTLSERTPLPQISRSLCKLENRDQVWLAEIIRSLSSRLSHVATSDRRVATALPDNDADAGIPVDEADAPDSTSELSAIDGVDAHASDGDTFDDTRQPVDGHARGLAVDAGFAARHPAHRHRTSPMDTPRQMAGNIVGIVKASDTPVPLHAPKAVDGIPGTDRYDGASSATPTRPSLPVSPKSDAHTQDGVRRYPAADEE